MEKRGQFFVFGAIILCLAIFVLVTKVNTYEEKILLEDFPDLTENYKTESVKVVNDALLNNLDPNANLDEFTNGFVQYARTISPSLGFVYAYKDPLGKVYVTNYYTQAVDVSGLLKKETTIFSDNENSVNQVNLDLNGFNFKKTIPTKLTYFDKSYNQYVSDSQNIVIDVGRVSYPLDLTGQDPLEVVAIDSTQSGNLIRVDVS